MKILIGIPAYNEEKLISQVVRSLPKKLKGIEDIDILVVDDGSTDKTIQKAKEAGAKVLRHILNRGLGGALKTILSYAKKKQYDILVTFDADGQHSPLDIPKMIEPIIKDGEDVVIGSRWKASKHIPFSRVVINKLANIITFLLFSIWTTDSQSGLRAFGKKAIKNIELQSDGMEVSSEFFREIYRNKLNFQEVPVVVKYTYYSRAKGQSLTNAPNILFHLLIRLLR
ncbi:glycosyltransferase family 2 protein [Candidatus Gottesmanbacteria bacterium]|nr:glycosyltransferase family 2 protein [Candidatus Gottesmanbacteria bacterium]